MSTVTTLLYHETASPPRLVRFKPRLLGREREHRKLSLHPDIAAWVNAAVQGESLSKSKAQIRVHFGLFVKGEKIDDCYFMKRIEDRRKVPPDFSHEIWAVSPRFCSQYRFFGVFATKDWFIIFNKQLRSRLDEYENRWHLEIDKADRTWRALFPTQLPLGGTSLADYVSSNAEHCDDRW